MRRFRLHCIAVALGIATLSARAQSDPKSQFVDALGQFSLALDGRYGDEGPRILASLEALEQGMTRWDDAIHSFEADIARNGPADPKLAALAHVALGGLHFDRMRLTEAKREFNAAIALDPSRPDTFVLRGLAESSLGDTQAAAQSFKGAFDLDPTDTVRAYMLARAFGNAGNANGMRAMWRTVLENQKREDVDRVAPAPRFMQFGIVAERTGVEPFFPPAIYADAFSRLQRGDLAGTVGRLRAAASSDALVVDSVNRSYAMRRAAEAFRDGDAGKAVEQLTAAIELYPDRSEPHRLLGVVYAADDRMEQGAAELKRAIALRPDDERSRLALADISMRSDELTSAEQVLGEASARIPASGRAHYLLARLYQRQNKLTEAFQEFRNAAALGPLLGLNGIYRTMGAIAAARQNFEGAVDAYTKLVDIQPNATDAHQALGEIYGRIGRVDEALAEFAVALAIDPRQAGAHAGMAQLLLQAGRNGEAAQAARRALDVEPAHRQARYSLGTALVRLGRTDEGQKELQEFERMQAQDAVDRARDLELGGLRREASMSSASGDHQKAVALLRHALEIAPRDMVSHLNLGLALMLAGQPAEAAERFTSALALDGPDEIHQHLAEAYARLGRNDDSRREMALYGRLKRTRLRRMGAEQ